MALTIEEARKVKAHVRDAFNASALPFDCAFGIGATDDKSGYCLSVTTNKPLLAAEIHPFKVVASEALGRAINDDEIKVTYSGKIQAFKK